jgi:maltose alpha-D-glucosyltransferase/alpha-amylase
MRNQARRSLQLLAQQRKLLPDGDQELADRVLAAEKEILSRQALIIGRRIEAMKTRIHGNLKLEKVLFTGKDFMIIDFEGEPDRTPGERRIKRSPLRDVAGMIRSFHNATLAALARHGAAHPGDIPLMEPWANACYYHVSCRYLAGYLARMGKSPLVPADRSDLEILLRSFLLDKALYELGYTLVNRPERAYLPLRGIETVLEEYRE